MPCPHQSGGHINMSQPDADSHNSNTSFFRYTSVV
jgi:hypothetical protein